MTSVRTVSQQEKPQHLEISVTADELPHPFHRPHAKEAVQVAVAVGIPEPCGEARLRDAVAVAQGHIPRLKRIRQMQEESIGDDRQHEEDPGSSKQPARGQSAEERKQHAHRSIKHQDVAAPKEKQVEKTYCKKHGHPPVKSPRLLSGILQLDAEADAEQDREQGVEFTVYEEILERPHHPVKGCIRGGIGESPQ